MTDLAIPEPGEMESKPKVDEAIFDHIRRKSKSFPDLMTLKTIDPSHQPLILAEVNTSIEQSGLDSIKTQEDIVVLTDSEPLDMSKHQEDGVVLMDKEQIDTLTESKNAGKYFLESNIHNIDKIKRFTNSGNFTNNQLKKRKLADNWINDIMVKECKRNRSDRLSDTSTTADFRNQIKSVGPKSSLDLQDGQQFSCMGAAPGGSMEVSFLGFKSVFSFL